MRRYKLWSTFTQNRIAVYGTLKEALKAGKAYTADTGHGFWISCDGTEVYRALAKESKQ